MRWIAWLIVAELASGCAGGSSAPARPAPLAPTPEPEVEAAPTERECDALITHAVALGIDEATARADPATPPTTQSDHEAIRRSLREDFLAGCRTLPRAALRCAMAATSLTALAACQRTPSSSTSNSKVAPGGMAPPAPRSP